MKDKEMENFNLKEINSMKEFNNKLIEKNGLNSRIYYYYFDYLRIFSSLGVVLIHVSSLYNILDINSINWKIFFF